MKRWFLAIGVLLGGGLSVAHAEYLRIIYNLSGANSSEEAKNGAQANPNQSGRPQVPTPPGMQPRNPRFRPPGNQPGGPQNPGLPRNPRSPGGPGGPNSPGVLPPWISGLFSSNPEDEEPLQAEVVVEYSRADAPTAREAVRLRGERGPQGYPTIHHRWGKTGIAPNLRDIRVEFVKENGVFLPPVARRYKNLREEKLKDKKNPDAATLLELAEWALTHYLLDDFVKAMEEIRGVDSKNPAVAAFDYYVAEMKKQPRPNEAEGIWKSRITNNKVKQTEHYTLLYSAKDDEPEEVRDYARRLEDNYRAFFYWFALKADALKGRRLKVPDTRLVAVLLDKPTEFESYREAFDNASVGGDGFFSRRENLAVFSTHRLDETFDLLEKSTKPLWQTGWNQEDLLKGGGHIGSQPDEIIRNQMIALLLRAMQDESALATVSHVASQQLVVAAGLLPRNVEVPEWIEFGMGSFFETPKGAFWPGVGAPSWRYLVKFKVWRKAEKDSEPDPDKEKDKGKEGTEPPKPGQRPTPNPRQTPPGQNPPGQNPPGQNRPGARRPTTTPLDPATEAIRFVITDKYFRDLRDEQRREDRRQAQGNSRALATKAETMAWSLTYFLMSRMPDQLMRYFDELNKLPRDIDFDDNTLLLTFGRAFDMVSDTNTGFPVLDNSKLDKLAEEWYSFLDYTNIESSEAMQDAVKEYQKKAKKRPTTPTQPKRNWRDYLPKTPALPRPRR